MVSRFLSPQNLFFRERFALEGSREQTELGFDERDTISRVGCNINKCKGELKGFFVFSKKKTTGLCDYGLSCCFISRFALLKLLSNLPSE